MPDRFIEAKVLEAPLIKIGNRSDAICSCCFKKLYTQMQGDKYRIASIRNPARKQTIHIFSMGGAICLDCLIDKLLPETSNYQTNKE